MWPQASARSAKIRARKLPPASSALPSMSRLAPKLLRGEVSPLWWKRESRALRRSVPVEHQCPELDTLARGRVGGRGRVDKGGMRPEPRTAVGCRIVALQQQRLVGPHFRNVVPAMVRVVFDRVGFTAAVRVNQVGSDEIAGLDGLAVGHCKRRIAQGSPDRPPDV